MQFKDKKIPNFWWPFQILPSLEEKGKRSPYPVVISRGTPVNAVFIVKKQPNAWQVSSHCHDVAKKRVIYIS